MSVMATVGAAVPAMLLMFFSEATRTVVNTVIFMIITLGQVRVQEPQDAHLTFPWHGFIRGRDGHWVVQDSVASTISMLLFLTAVGLYVALKVFISGSR